MGDFTIGSNYNVKVFPLSCLIFSDYMTVNNFPFEPLIAEYRTLVGFVFNFHFVLEGKVCFF